jgi:hypothetical protein
MSLDGAIITEQNVTFGIVIVQPHVLQNHATANQMIASCQRVLAVAPVVLMAQDGRGRPTYYGRKEIVNFLTNISVSRIPWKRYTIS